jgi:hypothetical protein
MMLTDIRLDSISNIDPQFIDMIKKFRDEMITIDAKLRAISSLNEANCEGVLRCLSLARTNIEMASKYGIKALCLMGEVKE